MLGTTISKDHDAVPLGNKKAHGGDVTTDRRLSENGTRFDDEIFQDLYGVHWARVRKIGKISAIQKNCGNLTPAIEDDVATVNALNKLYEMIKCRFRTSYPKISEEF